MSTEGEKTESEEGMPPATIEATPEEEKETEKTQFYPSHSLPSEETEVFDEKKIEKMKEIEKKLDDILGLIEEETMQLSEFVVEEKSLMKESCIFLRKILKKLRISFKIPANVVYLIEKPKNIFLNDEGHLILVYEDGRVISKPLEEYSPEIIMTVIWEILPELANSIRLYREKISRRVSFFDKVKKEFKNVFRVFASSESESEEYMEEEPEKDLSKAIEEE